MAAQAIKYQTTTIDANQSAGEIARLVMKYGGARFEMRWSAAGELEAVRFAIRAEELGEVPVVLRAATDRIEEVLRRAKPYTSRSRATREEYDHEIRAQAQRIAWRHIRDLTEQLLLAVHLGLRSIGAAFMADIEVWDDARDETVTMAEFLARRAVLEPGERGIRMLSAGEAPTVRRLPAGA